MAFFMIMFIITNKRGHYSLGIQQNDGHLTFLGGITRPGSEGMISALAGTPCKTGSKIAAEGQCTNPFQ
jgi:hypothetical protein